jgi:putative ABC transport system ATP-binding protein
MIRLRDVHLTLASSAGPVHILKGVDLDVAAGTSLSVVGPSGSGKSSLLAIIGGIERPSSGTVEVAGTDLGSLDEDGLALFRRQRVGVLFQSFHLIPTMTALENVALPLELAGRKKAFERARAGLAEVGLEQRLDHYPSQLSGGEQQRVALARALANEPELLLADEPTGNLDRGTGRQIAELIFAARERYGAPLFLITHDPALASLCDETRRMSDGRLDAGRMAESALVGAAS